MRELRYKYSSSFQDNIRYFSYSISLAFTQRYILTTDIKAKNSDQKKYRGRFAPSPSGELHFGSLLAAMASYADARSHNGSWLLRIDDIDQSRVVKYSDQHILSTLEQCGFQWDEKVSYQSQCLNHYQSALEQLKQTKFNTQRLCYSCTCSRKQLREISVNGIYPGLCRTQPLLDINDANSAIRIKVPEREISFIDQIQNTYSQQLAQDTGDFIIYRRDNIFSYQLSVVVDDFHSDISHIVRGYDLLESTPKQIYLQQVLGYPQPQYAHIPLAVTPQNLKLSKLSQAKKVNCDLKTLTLAAHFLGQMSGQEKGQKELKHTDFANKDDFWQYLIKNWDINRVPRMEKQVIMV